MAPTQNCELASGGSLRSKVIIVLYLVPGKYTRVKAGHRDTVRAYRPNR